MSAMRRMAAEPGLTTSSREHSARVHAVADQRVRLPALVKDAYGERLV